MKKNKKEREEEVVNEEVAIGSRKLSANEQFFVGAQTVVSLLQTTEIISHVFVIVVVCCCFVVVFNLFFKYMTMLLTPAQIKSESFKSRRNYFFCFGVLCGNSHV